MSKVIVNGIESIKIERSDDQYGVIDLTIEGEDGTTVIVSCGRFHEDAENLREMIDQLHDQAKDIDRNWEDRPDEEDGYVTFDRGAYFVTLSGSQVGQPTGYPTQDIATYHLAQAMTDAGYFPNAWYEGERGYSEDIGEAVRKFHDEGGTGMAPLEGATFEHDATVMADGWRAYVVKDYGKLGITYVLSGDDTIHFTEDRDTLTLVDDDSEE